MSPAPLKSLPQGLKRLELRGCTNLSTIAVWSDELTGLDMTDCKSLLSLDLYCPQLLEEFITVAPPDLSSRTDNSKYPPLVNLLRLQCRNKARACAVAFKGCRTSLQGLLAGKR